LLTASTWRADPFKHKTKTVKQKVLTCFPPAHTNIQKINKFFHWGYEAKKKKTTPGTKHYSYTDCSFFSGKTVMADWVRGGKA